MSVVDGDSRGGSCPHEDWTLPKRRRAPSVALAYARLVVMSSPARDHVLRLHRRGLIPPAGALVAEDRRHFFIAELVGECGHGSRVGDTTDGLARQSMQHDADVLGR